MGEPGIIGACIARDVAKVDAILAVDRRHANERDEFIGSTPLHFASHRGLTEIVERLLAAGGDPNARESCSGTTPLHWAAKAGHLDTVRVLLRAGSALEATEFWHELTPLGWATVVTHAGPARGDRAAVVEHLRARGARLDVFAAVALGDSRAVRRLVAERRSSLERRLRFASRGLRPVHLAAERGSAPMVRLLADLGADTRATTDFGLTPLALARDGAAPVLREIGPADDVPTAIRDGRLAEARALLGIEAGRAVLRREAPPERGPLLAWAAERGLASAVALLLHFGADPGFRVRALFEESPAELAPIHLAAMAGHDDVVDLLLGAGADPDARVYDMTGATPLHIAAAAGHVAVIEVLAERGADLGARDARRSATPLAWAHGAEHAEAAEALERRGAAG